MRIKMIRFEEVLSKLRDSVLKNEDGTVAVEFTEEQKESLTAIYNECAKEIKKLANALI
jgi:hypothetical protein